MISADDLYKVFTAVVPLYVAMILAYGSVRWWGIFTPDQCSGINRFVAIFAVPLLSFKFISSNNPYEMNLRFVAADVLQQLIVLAGLAVWSRLPAWCGGGATRLDWSITLFSLTTLPNTLAMGIPLLGAMYGKGAEPLLVQVVVLQSILWYTLLIFLFEVRAARRLIGDQFPGTTAAAIASLRVDPDVVSLGGGSAETESEVAEDGRLHVTVRCSSASLFATPRTSNLTSAEVYSMSSLRQHSPRGSNFNHADGFAAFSVALPPPRPSAGARCSSFGASEVYSVHSARSNFDEQFGSARVVPADLPLYCPDGTENGQAQPHQIMPPASVMIRLILIMVWRKLIRNPNTYASLIGLVWSLVSCRWHFSMPKIVFESIAILSKTGLGMAMFGLGLFMALQPRIIACGYRAACYSLLIRFLAGPFTMGIATYAIGIRGTLLRLAIVQASLPQGIVPFVFAKEYNLHPAILSTGVIFGLLISLPITLVYYIIAGLVK